MAAEIDGFFAPKQAADILGISRMTIFRWLKSGRATAVLVAGQRLITETELNRLKNETEKRSQPEGKNLM